MEIEITILALKKLLKLIENKDQETLTEINKLKVLENYHGDIKTLIKNLLDASIKLNETRRQDYVNY